MFSSLFRQFANSVGIVFRTFKNFFSRQIVSIWARAKMVTSLTRQASKLAPKMLQSATMAGKKPVKREDYVETKRMFIAKSFFVTVGIVLVAAGALIYFLVWPFLLSRFFTAKMWWEDKDAADHTGKVMLFYDREKEQLKFQGRLEEGLATGEGLYYDEDGLLIYSGSYVAGEYEGGGSSYDRGVLVYEGGFAGGVYNGVGSLYDAYGDLVYTGDFVDGIYEGSGKLFEEGELVYEGAFAAGIYEGAGSLYEGGSIVYKGGFAEGVFDGEGTAYSKDGVLYKGGFSEGKYNGEGVEYYAGGKIKYKGLFLDGLYSEEGALYNEDGSTKYSGGFAEGLYSGNGSLYLESNQRVDAEFESGLTVGDISWYKSGKLYYEGAAANLTPDGFGAIYTSTGTKIFEGETAMGSLALTELLGLEVNDARAALADCTLDEVMGPRGFVINATELGLSMFCSYKSEDADSAVYELYLYKNENTDPFVELVIWDGAAEFEEWLADIGAGEYERVSGWTESDYRTGLPFKDESLFCVTYTFEDSVCSLWSRQRGGELMLVEWRSDGKAPKVATLGASGGAAKSAVRVETLLSGLDKKNVGGAADGVAANPYYGAAPVAELLNAAGDTEKKYEAFGNLVSCFESAEVLEAAEQNLEFLEELLEDEESLIKTGSGSEERKAELESDIATLKLRISKYKATLDKSKMLVKNALGLDPAGYELRELLVLFDPAKIDRDALRVAVDACVRGVTVPTEPEQPTQPTEPEAPTEPETPDPDVYTMDADTVCLMATITITLPPTQAEIDAALMDSDLEFIELELAYGELKKAREDYEKVCKALEETEKAYKRSTADKTDIYAAISLKNDCRAAVYTSLAAFTAHAAEINRLSGGWLTREYGWLADAFPA